MSRQEIAWILVRSAGLMMLVQALMMLPALVTVLPTICQIIVSWDMIADTSWIELLSRGTIANTFSVISKTTFYFIAASWLLARGESLIRRIAGIKK